MKLLIKIYNYAIYKRNTYAAFMASAYFHSLCFRAFGLKKF